MLNTKDEAEAWRDYKAFLAEWAGAFGLIVSANGTMPLRAAVDQGDGDERRNLAIMLQLRRNQS